MGSVCDGYVQRDGCFQKPEFTETTHTLTCTLITHLDGMYRLNTGDGHKQGTHPHTLGLLTLYGSTLKINKHDLLCSLVYEGIF